MSVRMTVHWLFLLVLATLIPSLTSNARAQAPATQPAPAADPTAAEVVDVEAVIREALPKFTDREAGTAAVEKLLALSDERVLLVFKRIESRSLYGWNGQIVFVHAYKDDGTGKQVAEVFDLFTPADENGMPLGAPIATVPKEEVAKDFSPQRAVRNLVLNSLRLLGLKIADPAVRRAAARDLGNKRQLDALPELQKLAKNDPNAAVRRDAGESAQLIIASGTDPSATPDQRRAAVVALGELQSIRALDMIREMAAKPDVDPADAKIYAAAISSIETHASITKWISNCFFGLSAGSIYLLLALGLAITFGLMGVINMAHGEMLMIGAVTTWACCEYISPMLPPQYFNWYYVIALPMSFLVAAVVGLLIEVLIVRYLYKRPLDSLLATIGVSFVLIQAVRSWKGDNLGMRPPTWFTGGLELMQDVVLPYNRLFIIVLAIFCVLSVVAIFRFTKIGLMIRATVQNREMAQALGVNTRMVDMFTFAFGAGIAGIAGSTIVLLSNPTPEMGQGYIVKSFLTVVVGGVGKLMGVVISGLSLGFLEKMIEPITIMESPIKIFDATWAQVAVLIIVVLFMQRRPAGLFPDKGRMADQADRTSMPIATQTSGRVDLLMGLCLALLGLFVVPYFYGRGSISPEFVNKLGYILTFSICAIGLDLIWGYIGVLSLCQFMFFAFGGYCMGLYLINHGPMTNDGIPECLSYVMSAVANRTPPWFLPLFKPFPLAVFLGLLLPGLLALLLGLTTFRSRVRGVYFSILTQAVTVAAWLVFQKNDLKLGGTNGLTKFKTILGFEIAADASVGPFQQTRFWLYIATVIVLLLAIVVAKMLTRSGFGRVLVAIRDDETRLRFVGYQTWAYKAVAFAIAGMFAAVGGMLYIPQKGIITPHQMAAGASILVVVWVALGGRGSIWGAVFGALVVNLMYEWLTSTRPEYWPFVLGGMFVLVPLLLPGGIMSVPAVLKKSLMPPVPREKLAVVPESAAAEGGQP